MAFGCDRVLGPRANGFKSLLLSMGSSLSRRSTVARQEDYTIVRPFLSTRFVLEEEKRRKEKTEGENIRENQKGRREEKRREKREREREGISGSFALFDRIEQAISGPIAFFDRIEQALGSVLGRHVLLGSF